MGLFRRNRLRNISDKVRVGIAPAYAAILTRRLSQTERNVQKLCVFFVNVYKKDFPRTIANFAQTIAFLQRLGNVKIGARRE